MKRQKQQCTLKTYAAKIHFKNKIHKAAPGGVVFSCIPYCAVESIDTIPFFSCIWLEFFFIIANVGILFLQ